MPMEFQSTWKRKWIRDDTGATMSNTGNVCMDMIMVDVTDLHCEEGDAVVLFDSQETIERWAQKSDTISYEILTGISQRIARRIQQLLFFSSDYHNNFTTFSVCFSIISDEFFHCTSFGLFK